MDENEIAEKILDAAFTIHRVLGPGLFESVYERILGHELHKRGLAFTAQTKVPVRYDGMTFEDGFRADLIVERLVPVELKSVDILSPVHRKQVLTYLKLTGLRLGPVDI